MDNIGEIHKVIEYNFDTLSGIITPIKNIRYCITGMGGLMALHKAGLDLSEMIIHNPVLDSILYQGVMFTIEGIPIVSYNIDVVLVGGGAITLKLRV